MTNRCSGVLLKGPISETVAIWKFALVSKPYVLCHWLSTSKTILLVRNNEWLFTSSKCFANSCKFFAAFIRKHFHRICSMSSVSVQGKIYLVIVDSKILQQLIAIILFGTFSMSALVELLYHPASDSLTNFESKLLAPFIEKFSAIGLKWSRLNSLQFLNSWNWKFRKRRSNYTPQEVYLWTQFISLAVELVRAWILNLWIVITGE